MHVYTGMVNSKELRCTDNKWAEWPGKRIYHTLGHFANLLSVFQSQFFSANRSDLMSPPERFCKYICVQKKFQEMEGDLWSLELISLDLVEYDLQDHNFEVMILLGSLLGQISGDPLLEITTRSQVPGNHSVWSHEGRSFCVITWG